MTVTAKLNSKNIWYDFRNIVWKYIETNKIISPQDIEDDITVSTADSITDLQNRVKQLEIMAISQHDRIDELEADIEYLEE